MKVKKDSKVPLPQSMYYSFSVNYDAFMFAEEIYRPTLSFWTSRERLLVI